jgi:replicative DNA helicase
MTRGTEPRELPHRKEAEAAVLGGIMWHGAAALEDVRELIGEDDFYVPSYQATFRAMCLIEERGKSIDVIALHDQLLRTGELELVGGVEGLARLDRHATAHNIKAHAEIILEASRLRAIVKAGRDMAEAAMDPDADHTAIVGKAEKAVRNAAGLSKSAGPRSAKELMLEVFEGVRERQRSTEPVTGVATEFYEIDEMTAGLQPGDLVILAARPSMGKTALALNIAANACVMPQRFVNAPEGAKPKRVPVLVFSLEMGATQLIERLLCSEARVDYQLLRRGGRMSESEFRALIAAAERVADAPLWIDDQAALSITEMRGRARRWRENPKVFPDPEPNDDGKAPSQLGLVMVDYLQLARGGQKKYASRENEISEISQGLKAMAKDLKMPVVALAQLNRAVDARSDHRPQLSDLRESGAIEQDADVIMFIYREERYLPPTATEEQRAAVENKAEIGIAKQRNGPVGTVNLTFVKKHTRFENPAREYDGP